LNIFEEILGSSYLLTETMSASEIQQLDAELMTPEILPCTFDVTIPGWLARIKLWGKVKIRHQDPENFWGKRKVTIDKFLEKISNQELTRMLGKWSFVKQGLTSVTCERDYQTQKGKWVTETFFIDVDLRKELR